MAACELEGAALDAAVARAEGDNPAEGEPLPYSRAWSLAGPIIEREQIAAWVKFWYSSDSDGVTWEARVRMRDETSTGPTPLIAAMRAYVASKATP